MGLLFPIDYLAKVDAMVYNLTSGRGHLKIRFTVSLSLLYVLFLVSDYGSIHNDKLPSGYYTPDVFW